MNTDFIPHQDAQLLLWCTNYRTQITIIGPQIGLSVEKIGLHQSYCDNMISAIVDLEAKKTATAASVNSKVQVFKQDIGNLRGEIVQVKSNPLATVDIQKKLDIAPKHKDFDGGNYKATLTVELVAGVVRIKFIKLGADGINIYHRKKGDIQWLFLVRATKSPFDDHITLATPGQPEHWEYRAFGVENDLEIGQPSNIIEIVFGG
jgi:hypothetical protein